MAINLPYPVTGKILDTDGTTGIGSGFTVRLRNETTNEILSIVTDSNSDYVLDGGNFPSGYLNTDKFTVYAIAQSLFKEATLTVSDNKHQFSLTLATISDTTTINLCTLQDVYDYLDGIGADDVSAIRLIGIIQNSEAEIEEKANIAFSQKTATAEIIDYNQYNSYRSPENLVQFSDLNLRNDYIFHQSRDRVKLNNRPIISITTLARNTAGPNSTDNFESLTEQTGSGGDFVLTDEGKAAGFIDFIRNIPRFGKRAIKITYEYGYATTPRNARRLCILLSVRDVLLAKINRSYFDTTHRVSLKGITIERDGAPATHLNSLNQGY